MLELVIVNCAKKGKKKKLVDKDQDEPIAIDDSQTLPLLIRLLDTVKCSAEECELTVNENGFTIQVMDSMHASITDIFISAKLFDEFRCDRSLIIGIKIADLLKILNGFNTDSAFILRLFSHDDSNFLGIHYESANFDIDFELSLFKLNLERYDFPTQEYDNEVEMPCKDFLLVSNLIGTFDNHITIEAKDKNFVFRQGGERTKSSITYKQNDNITIKNTCAVTKEIAMKYIKSISLATKMSENVRICLGETSPVFFDFSLNDGGFIRFYIAPKIEDDIEMINEE